MSQWPGDLVQHLDTLFLCNGARIKRDMRGRDTPFVAIGGGDVFGIDVLDIAPVAKLVNGGRVAALFLQLAVHFGRADTRPVTSVDAGTPEQERSATKQAVRLHTVGGEPGVPPDTMEAQPDFRPPH